MSAHAQSQWCPRERQAVQPRYRRCGAEKPCCTRFPLVIPTFGLRCDCGVSGRGPRSPAGRPRRAAAVLAPGPLLCWRWSLQCEGLRPCGRHCHVSIHLVRCTIGHSMLVHCLTFLIPAWAGGTGRIQQDLQPELGARGVGGRSLQCPDESCLGPRFDANVQSRKADRSLGGAYTDLGPKLTGEGEESKPPQLAGPSSMRSNGTSRVG